MSAVRREDAHEGSGVALDTRPKRYRVQDREHAGADSDAECERHDDRRRQERIGPHVSQRKPEVSADFVDDPQATRLSAHLLVPFHATELHAGRAQRNIGREAGALEIIGAMRDVTAELVAHVALESRTHDGVTNHGGCE